MTIPLKKLMLRGVALALVAAIGYAAYMLYRLAPIATGYAAKALCSSRMLRLPSVNRAATAIASVAIATTVD